MFDGFIEAIYPYLLKILDESRIAITRKRFFSLIGDVYEDEPFYNERMNAFLEWLLVDAKILGQSKSLLTNILDLNRDYLNREVREMAESMISSRRSLFLIVSKRERFSVLEDIFDKGRFYVNRDLRIDRTEKRSIVETRILLFRGESQIVNTYLVYPEEHKKVILKRLKTYIKNPDFNRERFLEYSSALYIRSSRYRNIPPAKVAISLDHFIYG